MEKSKIKIKECKKIETLGKDKKPNGWLLELISDQDKFTKHINGQVYLTVANPGVLKGYHLHAQADYYVMCLKGKVKEIIYTGVNKKHEIKMGDGDFKKVFLPKGYPHAIKNIGKEKAYVLVYRAPAWDPKIMEQFDIDPKDINKKATWAKIRKFIKEFNSN